MQKTENRAVVNDTNVVPVDIGFNIKRKILVSLKKSGMPIPIKSKLSLNLLLPITKAMCGYGNNWMHTHSQSKTYHHNQP